MYILMYILILKFILQHVFDVLPIFNAASEKLDGHIFA